MYFPLDKRLRSIMYETLEYGSEFLHDIYEVQLGMDSIDMDDSLL